MFDHLIKIETKDTPEEEGDKLADDNHTQINTKCSTVGLIH